MNLVHVVVQFERTDVDSLHLAAELLQHVAHNLRDDAVVERLHTLATDFKTFARKNSPVFRSALIESAVNGLTLAFTVKNFLSEFFAYNIF